MRSTFRILSLDGGGARGFLSAKILSNIEDTLASRGSKPGEGDRQAKGIASATKPLGEYFDLIVGTSTGAILAAGLAVGLRASELVEVYEEGLPTIFRKRSWLNPLAHKGPTYSSSTLRKVLSDVLGNRTLDDVSTDTCLVAVSLLDGQPRLYKSDYLGRNTPRCTERLADIVLASAAAPTFFKPALELKHSTLLVDGGVCANNPAMIALVDASQFERPSRSRNTPSPERYPQDISLLSIGTGKRAGLPFSPDGLKNAGKFRWVKPGFFRSLATEEKPSVPIIELMMESQVRLIENQVEVFMREGRYLRINPSLNRNYALDDVRHLREFLNYADLDAAAHEWIMANLAEQNDRRG